MAREEAVRLSPAVALVLPLIACLLLHTLQSSTLLNKCARV